MRNPVGLFHLWGVYVPVSKTNIDNITTDTVLRRCQDEHYFPCRYREGINIGWILSFTGNMCAHNSRIYNRTIHTTPEILDADRITPPPVHNGLYQILLAMKYLRSSDEEWTAFMLKPVRLPAECCDKHSAFL